MKRARIITAAVAAIIAIILTVSVCFVWSKQGCGWESLVAAIAFYGLSTIGLWFVADEAIRERAER